MCLLTHVQQGPVVVCSADAEQKLTPIHIAIGKSVDVRGLCFIWDSGVKLICRFIQFAGKVAMLFTFDMCF